MPARHILVVDDEQNVRDITKLLLEMSGHTVGCAEDGQEALRELAENTYDGVIADMLMPGMDGVELLNELKNWDVPLRVVAMSGGGHAPKESYLKIAQLAGAHALLPKPFNREQLDRAVAEAFREAPPPVKN
ncbi:MAG: response regulator [Opitutaceae bacterium]|nr:response regulator [Opitutaceae bacterium]MBP9912274.1 response regulator [Opitutaceae bacterium]